MATANAVEDDIHSFAYQAVNFSDEVQTLVINGNAAQFSDDTRPARRTCAVHRESGEMPKLQECRADSTCRAVNQNALTRSDLGGAMQHLVRGDVVKDEADSLGGIELGRHRYQFVLRQADEFRVRSVNRQRRDRLARFHTSDTVTESIHETDEIPPRRVGHLRRFGVDTFARQDVRQGDACGQHFHPNLTTPRFGALLLDHLKCIRSTVVSDDDTSMFHGIFLASIWADANALHPMVNENHGWIAWMKPHIENPRQATNREGRLNGGGAYFARVLSVPLGRRYEIGATSLCIQGGSAMRCYGWGSVVFLLWANLCYAETEKIGQRACLFLDDRFIAEQSGLKRVWHQGKPHSEPALKREHDWEQWPHLYGSVFRDPKDGMYKMYYVATNYPSLNPPSSFTSYICLAESKDGKKWTRPMLRLHEHKGSKENNIVIKYAELANILIDPSEKDPDARLKMFVYLMSKNPHGGQGECLLASGDGIHWKYVGPYDKPKYADQAHARYTDSHFFMYDPLRRRYLSYVRTWVKSSIAELKDGRRRAVGISESQEINRKWSPIVNVLAADDLDDAKAATWSKDPTKPDWAEIYCMSFFDYGNHYLGMMSLFFILDGVDTGGAGDIQLTYSHDGFKWNRQPERGALIARSDAKDLFPTYTTTNAPLEIGDELWVYYSEANGAHPLQPFSKSISQIRAAIWRKDGFVSLAAGKTGSLRTKPFVLEGDRLVLNAKTAQDGYVRATLLDDSGKEIPGYGPSDALKGDQVRGTLRWAGNADLSTLKGQTVALRIEMSQGELYSFRAEGMQTEKAK